MLWPTNSTRCCRAYASPSCCTKSTGRPASRRLHQSAHRRTLRQRERAARRHPGRRHQSRADPHGGGQPGRHPRPADLDRRRLYPARDLQGGARQDHRRAPRPADRGDMGRRHHLIVGRPILPLRPSAAMPPARSTRATAQIPASASTPMSRISTAPTTSR